jgi:hypothetical protein
LAFLVKKYAIWQPCLRVKNIIGFFSSSSGLFALKPFFSFSASKCECQSEHAVVSVVSVVFSALLNLGRVAKVSLGEYPEGMI